MPFDPTTYPTPVIPAQAPDKDAEVRERAACILETNGWLQFSFGKDGGPRCLGGALSEANALRSVAILEAMFPGVADAVMAGVNWNNAPGRTMAEVAAKLRNQQ